MSYIKDESQTNEEVSCLRNNHVEVDNTRIFPHVQESLLRKVSVNIVCIKSPDTDVFILGIRFQKEFRDQGYKELWLITVISSKKQALGCHITLRKALNHNSLKFCSHYTHWQGVTLLVSYVQKSAYTVCEKV